MKVLVTGFGPFQGHEENPSSILVDELIVDEIVLRKEIFSVNREDIELRYSTILNDFNPDFILNIGLNASSGGFNLETFAINSLKDNSQFSTINDNFGFQTSIDTISLSTFLSNKGIPSIRSDYAGSYYCNYIYYMSLEWCEHNKGTALFLHIPFTTELSSKISLGKKIIYPSLPKALMLKGIKEIILYQIDSDTIIT